MRFVVALLGGLKAEPTPVVVEDAIAQAAARHAEKRRAALAWIGRNWVHHPDYDSRANAHHAPSYKLSKTLADFRRKPRRAP